MFFTWFSKEEAREGARWLVQTFSEDEVYKSFAKAIKQEIAEREQLNPNNKKDANLILRIFQDIRNCFQQEYMVSDPNLPFYGKRGFHKSEAIYLKEVIIELNISRGRFEVLKNKAIKAQQLGFPFARHDRNFAESRIFEIENQLETHRQRLAEITAIAA